MAFNKWMLLGATMLLITPTWADNVYYAGFEDAVNGDYDYNDLVLSLSGDGIQLQTATGVFSPEPALGTSGSPFWNHSSGDGTNFNVGYCMYGGGNCNGGTGLDPNAQYLATAAGGPVNDVFFTVDSSSPVAAPVFLHIAADANLIGWYAVGDPTDIHWINSWGTMTGNFSFSPTGSFGLVGNNAAGFGQNFYSQTAAGGTQDPFGSHFAFFGDDPVSTSVPEPGSVVLFGTALLGFSLMLRRRRNAGQ